MRPDWARKSFVSGKRKKKKKKRKGIRKITTTTERGTQRRKKPGRQQRWEVLGWGGQGGGRGHSGPMKLAPCMLRKADCT